MQTSCLRLMGKKLLVSLAMEGKFSNEGLQGLEDDDDVLTATARELVTQKGVGDSASAIWKALQEQHARLLPPSSTLDDGEHATLRTPRCQWHSERFGVWLSDAQGITAPKATC